MSKSSEQGIWKIQSWIIMISLSLKCKAANIKTCRLCFGNMMETSIPNMCQYVSTFLEPSPLGWNSAALQLRAVENDAIPRKAGCFCVLAPAWMGISWLISSWLTWLIWAIMVNQLTSREKKRVKSTNWEIFRNYLFQPLFVGRGTSPF